MSGYGRILAAALVATAALFAMVGASSAGTSWTLTKTHALSLKGTPTGKLAPATKLHISVALKMRHSAALLSATRSGSHLTAAQFRAHYSPTRVAARSVATYLRSEGFRSVHVTSNRLFVTGTATAAQAERAFKTSLETWTVKGKTLFANSTAARVPSSLAHTVLSVLGLNDAAKLNAKPADPSVPNYLVSYNPQDFWKAYDVGTTAPGTYTAIAIFGSGDMTSVVKDLRTEEIANKLPQVPETTVYTGPVSPQNGDALEWDMDTQYSTGMAGTVSRLYIYSATSLTDSDLALAFNKFAAQNLARAGSASFGECEYQAYLDGSMVAWDQIFAEAAAQGQTVFASSGDTGGFCPVAPNNGVPAGIPDVNYPASSPYVVSVGGTTLLTNPNGTYDTETAWFAGGGGLSYFEYQPYWQDSAAIPTGSACVDAVACAGKNVPDIAMDADPLSGANVYTGSQPEGVGGTSLSSPLSLGVWARLETTHSNRLGFAAPDLYAAYNTAGYHDVQLGDTGPYPATPGYDLATGMGTFDVAKMNSIIRNAAYTPGGSKATYKVSSPQCTILSDQAGDSSPITATDNGESTDILAAGFSTGSGNLTAKLRVDSLSAGPGGTPGIAGDGDVWYVTWTYGKTEYFLSAETPGSSVDTTDPLPTDYSYGTVTTSPTGGLFYNTVGSATGSMNVKTNELTITAPLKVLGGTPSGVALLKTGAQTYASVGTPVGGFLELSDSAGPGASYTVGTNC
jgi:pseudomonalisin